MDSSDILRLIKHSAELLAGLPNSAVKLHITTTVVISERQCDAGDVRRPVVRSVPLREEESVGHVDTHHDTVATHGWQTVCCLSGNVQGGKLISVS